MVVTDYAGKVCVCSIGRVGVVTGKKCMNFGDGWVDMWTGIGFDGKGLWATSSPIVIADTLEEYVSRVERKPNNVLYGQIAVAALPAGEKSCAN